MKYMTLFLQIDLDNYYPLIDRYQNETDLKQSLSKRVELMIEKEVENIEIEKAEMALSQTEKL
jgi:hypothetical protein